MVAILVVAGLGTCSRSTLSYTAICARCLQHASGIEKSIFGVRYYSKEVHQQASGGLMSPDIFGPPIAQIDPHLFEEITGHPCAHVFMRGGFCRYSSGMVGCGSFGGRRYEFRNALIENLYRAYLRVPDKPLARETVERIDQLYPITSDRKNAPEPPMQHPFEAEALPNEPLSILLRGLALVTTHAEWRKVLDAARAGNGSLGLLQEQGLLATRLEHPDPTVRIQAIDQLAAMKNPEAWSKLVKCLGDPQTREHTAQRIVWARYFLLFDAVFEADEKARSRDTEVDPVRYLPEPFGSIIADLKPKEIRTLLAQQKPRVNLIAFAAIRQQDRFEFLDEVVAVLNQRPSPGAVETIETLIEGPSPLGVKKTPSGKSAGDPWAAMKADTSMAPVEQMSGFTAGGKRMYRIQQDVVRLGTQSAPANWSKLRDLYAKWLSERGAEWWAAGFSQAMAESDRAKTLDFLSGELDTRYERQARTSGALASLGIIADHESLAVLEAFREKAKGSLFETNPHYRKFLDYALHRCRGIHRWRLVKNADGTFSIQRLGEAVPTRE